MAAIDARADDQPEDRAQRGPNQPMNTPWMRKTRRMRLRCIPIARRMPISRVLSRTHHRQRPDDVEGRDDADQKNHQPHRQLLELERGEQRAVLQLPIERAIRIPQQAFELLPCLRGALRVGEPHFDPSDGTA